MNQLHKEKLRVQGKVGSLNIYKQLKGMVFNEYHGFFTLCVFLGYRSKRIITQKRKREQLFWSDTFSAREYASFYSLLIKDSNGNDYSILKNGSESLEILQNYADGGFDVFMESDLMEKFVEKDSNGQIYLDVSAKDHLQKQVMYYVYDLYQDV